MNTITSLSRYNLFFLFISIVWQPLQIYYLHIDGAARSLLILGLVALLLNISLIKKNKDIFGSSLFVSWTLLVIYSLINSMIHGFVSQYSTILFIRYNFLDSFIFLLITIIELRNDKYKCLKVILMAQLLFLLLGAMHISFVHADRAINEELGNLHPVMAASCFWVTGLLFIERQLKGKWFTIALILMFVLFIIILSATRKAFGALIIVFVGITLGYNRKLSLQSRFMIIIVSVILYFGINYVLDNTFMGLRITESSKQFDVPLSSNPVVNDFLMTLLGDRSLQYLMGMEIFHQHPFFGIGLLNYPIVTHTIYRIHSEYMVQLCENGIVGFSLLMFFYVKLFKGLNAMKKKWDSGLNNMIYLSGLLMVLFLNLTSWTYNQMIIMIVYAILINGIYSNSIRT